MWTTCRYWIRATLSLVMIMGIAWIFNVLFFIEELIFVAYIMTVFIAGQGLIIFILFVLLSKQVSKWNFSHNQPLPTIWRVLLVLQAREAYMRYWKNKKAQSEFLSKLSWSTKSTEVSSKTTVSFNKMHLCTHELTIQVCALASLMAKRRRTSAPAMLTSLEILVCDHDLKFIDCLHCDWTHVLVTGAGCDIPEESNAEITESVLDSYKEDLASWSLP